MTDTPQRDGPSADSTPAPDAGTTADDHGIVDAAAAFGELSKIRLSDTDLNAVLARVAELAKATVAGADAVSVTLVTNGEPGTVAHTDELALALDEAQYERGYGPCLDAARDHETYAVHDTTTETRWQGWTANAAEFGVRSSVSTGLPLQQTVTGALNVYSRTPDVFDHDARELLATFAGYAAVALANAHLYATTAALSEQMAQAMKTRAVIEQAKGVLVSQQHVSPEEAFNILVRASQVGNRKLRDIAVAIVEGAAREDGQP
jgi:GAF domain-containing protein